MISANISSKERKAIYKRDGYRCALCDSTRYLQIHHNIPRGQNGTNSPHNLITLCADYYAPQWNPWASNPYPCPDCISRKTCVGGCEWEEDETEPP